jgi:hypothetical protein
MSAGNLTKLSKVPKGSETSKGAGALTARQSAPIPQKGSCPRGGSPLGGLCGLLSFLIVCGLTGTFFVAQPARTFSAGEAFVFGVIAAWPMLLLPIGRWIADQNPPERTRFSPLGKRRRRPVLRAEDLSGTSRKLPNQQDSISSMLRGPRWFLAGCPGPDLFRPNSWLQVGAAGAIFVLVFLLLAHRVGTWTSSLCFLIPFGLVTTAEVLLARLHTDTEAASGSRLPAPTEGKLPRGGTVLRQRVIRCTRPQNSLAANQAKQLGRTNPVIRRPVLTAPFGSSSTLRPQEASTRRLQEECQQETGTLTQRILRRTLSDGTEMLEGELWLEFAGGVQTQVTHLIFSPPFACQPEVAVRQLAGPSARIRLGQVLPQGIRVELRLGEKPKEKAWVGIALQVRGDSLTRPG